MKKIKFVALNRRTKEIEPSPKPAQQFVPEWYKNTLNYESNLGGARKLIDYVKNINKGDAAYHATFKMCQPFLDAMTSGYMVTLPATIVVVQEVGKDGVKHPRLYWNTTFNIADAQDPLVASRFPTPHGYSKELFRWINNWKIETPAGYSLLYVHPINRNELPFHTLTGFVDSDKLPNPVVLPFVIKDGFEGEIPLGTPIAQVFPIKRDNWQSSEHLETFDYTYDLVKQGFEKVYKKLWWSKKVYR
jgi:hypothetical protein